MKVCKPLLKTAVYSFPLKELWRLHPSPTVQEGDKPTQASYNKGEDCCSAVRLERCSDQSLTEHRVAGFIAYSTSALLLVVSEPLYNTREVWTTLGKWQNYSNSLKLSRVKSWFPGQCPPHQAWEKLWRGTIHSWCSISTTHGYKEGGKQPFIYCFQGDEYTLHTWVLYLIAA